MPTRTFQRKSNVIFTALTRRGGRGAQGKREGGDASVAGPYTNERRSRLAVQALPLQKPSCPSRVFGQIEPTRGFRQFLLRGVEKVSQSFFAASPTISGGT